MVLIYFLWKSNVVLNCTRQHCMLCCHVTVLSKRERSELRRFLRSVLAEVTHIQQRLLHVVAKRRRPFLRAAKAGDVERHGSLTDGVRDSYTCPDKQHQDGKYENTRVCAESRNLRQNNFPRFLVYDARGCVQYRSQVAIERQKISRRGQRNCPTIGGSLSETLSWAWVPKHLDRVTSDILFCSNMYKESYCLLSWTISFNLKEYPCARKSAPPVVGRDTGWPSTFGYTEYNDGNMGAQFVALRTIGSKTTVTRENNVSLNVWLHIWQ